MKTGTAASAVPTALDAEAVGEPIAEALRAGAALAAPERVYRTAEEPVQTHFVAPDGYQVVTVDTDTEQWLDQPRRKTGQVEVRDAESFLAYFTKHATPAAEVYADEDNGRVVAVLNASSKEQAEWGDHCLVLALKHTPAWLRWTRPDGKLLGQVAFAEHIEAGLPEIVEPDAAHMLELAQTFEATKGVDFESSQRLSSGERQFTYKETISAKAGQKGHITVPTQFVVALAPWRGGPAYRVTARFRYRISPEGLQLGYVLDRVEDVLEGAFADVCSEVAGGVGERPLLMGPAPASRRLF